MSNDINFEDNECVVFGHQDFCQTAKAKWICIEDIYQKFHRPNMYDLGATYIEDVPDYWFLFMTREVGDIFLLDLFINRHHEKSFNIAVADSNVLRLDKKTDIVYLGLGLQNYDKKKENDSSSIYITTYDFSIFDIEFLKNRKLYIPISFYYCESFNIDKSLLDKVKHHHDFGELLNDPFGSDFTIESSEGEKFQVHKILLSAHSDVFKAMLKEETVECQNSYVKLVDVCKEDLKCILEFIYTGTVKQLDSNCINLLMLADRYNLDGLKDLTQHTLCFQITKDTVFEILVLADMYNAELLKTAAFKHIKKYSSILQNSKFDEIKNSELVRELCKYLAA